MTTDTALRWWAVLALHLVAAIALATAIILLLTVVAGSSAASAAALPAVSALTGTL